MTDSSLNYRDALQDFNDARRKAAFQEILARLIGKSNELLSYEEIAKKLKLNVRTEGGIQEIPVKAIVGSVGRYTEFTRNFLPRKNDDQVRWARVKSAIDDPRSTGLPPIEVYKVGEVYFVLDGNHRVSVARREGFEYMEAHVIEVKTDIQITPDLQPDDLIIKSEYADFLEETDFSRLRPGVDLSVTVPGQYEKLLDHIQVHRYFMGIDFQRDISFSEAVGHWYDKVYSPIVEPIRERGLLRWFPGRTETDMYLWVSEYRYALESELGWSIRPEVAVTELAIKKNPDGELSDTGSWRLTKMYDRYTDRLFRDILVSIDGSLESWQALEQAILVAQREETVLHGLHVVSRRAKVDTHEAQEIQNRFNQRCQEANVTGSLAIVKGDISKQVCERALLTDLVVLSISHPPLPGLSGLNSGLRSIIWRSARPILTVSGKLGNMDNVLLAFDGSPKSREALFVATYLAEKWKASLTVLTVAKKAASSVQDYVRSYLNLHEVQAEFIVENGPPEMIIKIIEEKQINLVLMGGYSGSAWKEIIFGSMVNLLLRKADCPLLICR
ncbi:MAG: universal stress protein [Chloroflexota bacterium]